MIQDILSIEVQPGTYVVAVSGGVDSIALLDLLARQPDLRLIVAHFDHGIRPNSSDDRQLVQETAKKYSLPFVYHEGALGFGVSEDTARQARYEFLHSVREAAGARAIITAHHHDDALETAVMNLIRGTNRSGVTSLKSRQHLLRPMLHLEKRQLREYARDQGLVWREDHTNLDTKYFRNYVRHRILPKLTNEQRLQLRDIIHTMRRVNEELDTQLIHYLHLQPAVDQLSRKDFIQLPHTVAREVMAAWLRKQGVKNLDKKMLERVVIAAKTYRVGRLVDLSDGYQLRIKKEFLALEYADR